MWRGKFFLMRRADWIHWVSQLSQARQKVMPVQQLFQAEVDTIIEFATFIEVYW